MLGHTSSFYKHVETAHICNSYFMFYVTYKNVQNVSNLWTLSFLKNLNTLCPLSLKSLDMLRAQNGHFLGDWACFMCITSYV